MYMYDPSISNEEQRERTGPDGIKGSRYAFPLKRNSYREADGRIHSSWGSGFTTDCRYLYVGSTGDKATPGCKSYSVICPVCILRL